MKKFLLALLLALAISPAYGAISYFGACHSPGTDNTDDSSVGPTVTCTPPGSMLVGDVVVVYVSSRSDVSNVKHTVTTSGGQNWHTIAQMTSTGSGGANKAELFWCTYNGTWAADPIFDGVRTDTPMTMWLAVFRGVDPSYPIGNFPQTAAIDVAATTGVAADYSTLVDASWAIVLGSSRDDNTWSVDNSFIALTGNIYWRTLAGADGSIVFCKKTITVAGAVGATTITEATLGADGGTVAWFSLRPLGSARRGVL